MSDTYRAPDVCRQDFPRGRRGRFDPEPEAPRIDAQDVADIRDILAKREDRFYLAFSEGWLRWEDRRDIKDELPQGEPITIEEAWAYANGPGDPLTDEDFAEMDALDRELHGYPPKGEG